MDQFIIKTEKGFYRDFILGTFVDDPDEAHKFIYKDEAEQVKKALEVMDGIKEASVLKYDPGMQDLIKLARQYVQEAEINAELNPSSDEIQVVIVEPGAKPYKTFIRNEAAAFNEIVGGGFGMLTIGKTDKGATTALHLHDEGKIIGLPFNRKIISSNNHFNDTIVGTFFITAFNMQGDNISLSDQEAEAFIRKFGYTEVYL